MYLVTVTSTHSPNMVHDQQRGRVPQHGQQEKEEVQGDEEDLEPLGQDSRLGDESSIGAEGPREALVEVVVEGCAI